MGSLIACAPRAVLATFREQVAAEPRTSRQLNRWLTQLVVWIVFVGLVGLLVPSLIGTDIEPEDSAGSRSCRRACGMVCPRCDGRARVMFAGYEVQGRGGEPNPSGHIEAVPGREFQLEHTAMPGRFEVHCRF